LTPSVSRNNHLGYSGYSVATKKRERFASILKDISILIGDLTTQPVTLEAGNSVIPGLGLTSEAAYLVDCITYIRHGVFRISVFGAFNAGKSTLLNALLGTKILPAYPLPTTAMVTNLVYGGRIEIMIYEEAWKDPDFISWETFSKHFILSKIDIDTIDTQGRMRNGLRSIKFAQAELQYPLLASGIRLTDTPGLGVIGDYTRITRNYLKPPETALLFVLNATNPFPEEVTEFLSTEFEPKCLENVFFIINRMDQINPTVVDSLKQNIHHIVQQLILDKSNSFDYDLYARRVFYTSAKSALEARIALPEDSAMLEASGVPALERELELFLTSDEICSKALEPFLLVLQSIVDRARQRVVEEKATLHESGQLNAHYSVVEEKSRLDIIESNLLELLKKANTIATDKDFATQSSYQIETSITSSTQFTSFKQSEQLSPPPISSRSTKKLQLDGPDPIEAWIAVDDHLQLVEQVTERYDLPYDVITELHESIKQIHNRFADPNLYLAVVGEFSSGKSTFINALLRQKLLKASVLPTTATAVRLHYGARLDVSVLFKNKDKPFSYLEDSIQLWQLLRSINSQQVKDGDICEFIHLVTSDDSIASRIDKLVIYHPASILEDGIVIIDTPGTNALSEHHALVTSQLIQQEADAAVIIIPGPLLSQSLKEFITDRLRPFLHRSLFVVTQMDKIPEEEQEQVIEYLRSSITNSLGIHQPLVIYQAAAQVALNALGENKAIRPELEHWKARFISLEYAIWEYLHRERTLSIAERLGRLMTCLFEQLDNHLRERQSKYEKQQMGLEQRINAFITNLQSASDSTISRHRHELQDLSHLQNCVQSDLCEIERRREALHQKQLQLATIII
jgi:GTPase Era involved in 16S rRNA processing